FTIIFCHLSSFLLISLPPTFTLFPYTTLFRSSPGYWRDPEKTRAVFLSNPFASDPADRIYRTGDLARIGDDGLVYFLGRADSQIDRKSTRLNSSHGSISYAVFCLKKKKKKKS